MEHSKLTAEVKNAAREFGFQLAGIAPAVTPVGVSRFEAWLEAGYAGQMHYIPRRREAYRHPRHVLDGVRSVVMLAMNYATAAPLPPSPRQARVSRYAWGNADYHDLIHQRLAALVERAQALVPGGSMRGVVDTAPLLEREFAQLAGIGWIGKNTMLINKQQGSWFFLAALLTDQLLEYDAPHEADHCGTCRACLDACPTDAFPEPYVLDATRCISYLTIELREPIPRELREGVGDWLFGCDVCQEVCPWNRKAPRSQEAAFHPAADANPLDAAALFAMDEDAFRKRFRHTPLWRSRRRGILRNAAMVLGNRPSPEGLQALLLGLQDKEPLVRGASAWALGRYVEQRAQDALRQREQQEEDEMVRQEIRDALAALSSRKKYSN